MLKIISFITIFTILTSCGGGSNSGGGESGSGGDQPVNQEVSLICDADGDAEAGGNVTATFTFSQTVNGPATIQYGILGGVASIDNVMVNGNQLIVTRTIPNNIPLGESFGIRLTLTNTGLSELCSWLIPIQLIIGS